MPKNSSEREHGIFSQLELSPAELAEAISGQRIDRLFELRSSGVLDLLPSGEIGFVDLNGKEQWFPDQVSVECRLNAHPGLLQAKVAQGFSELLIVPFGMALSDLVPRVRQEMNERRTTDWPERTYLEQSGMTVTNRFDEQNPLFFADIDADVSGDLLYYPETVDFETPYGAKTKSEILAEGDAAWMIALVQPGKELKAWSVNGEHGETIGGRRPLPLSRKPSEYLSLLASEPAYRGESGYTIETYLTMIIRHLAANPEVSQRHAMPDNDFHIQLLGNCYAKTNESPASGVLHTHFRPDTEQLWISDHAYDYVSRDWEGNSARSAVILGR